MAFLESRIDPRITMDVVFEETVPGRAMSQTRSGKTIQEFLASAPLTVCDLAHGPKSARDYQALIDAWYIVMFTPYEGLRVKNWRDYIATQANTTATFLTGSTTELKLQRLHSFGGIQFKRDIVKPCAAPAVAVYRTRGGSPSVITAAVDTTTGIATISGHVDGDTYAWTGEFDLPMTFSDNKWSATLIPGGASAAVVSGTIKMQEIRL
jgi:hypothetical protein